MSKFKKVTVFICGIASGVLGSFGGGANTSKGWRRLGIPVFLLGAALAFTKNIWSILIMGWGAVMSIGYGQVSPDDPVPSRLGKFWYGVFKKNLFLADLFTRTTIGILYAVVLAIIAFFKGNWDILVFTAPACIVINILAVFLHKAGMFKFLGKWLLWEETLVFGLLGIAGICQLIF